MVIVTTTKLLTPIIIHKAIAKIRGFIPTFFIVDNERLAPIKNKVKTNPFFAIQSRVVVSC